MKDRAKKAGCSINKMAAKSITSAGFNPAHLAASEIFLKKMPKVHVLLISGAAFLKH